MKNRWPTQPLADLLEVQNGYAFDSDNFSATKGTPLIRIRDLKGGLITETRYDGPFDDRYLVRHGDLLIGMDGEFGCYEWRGEPALLNQRTCRLHRFDERLLPRFLLYGVNGFLKAIEDVTGFTTVKHLSSKQILAIKFPIPPLAEQRRIVGILDEAFAAIATAKANAEKNLRNARGVFESHLQDVFTRRDSTHVARRLEDVCEKITVGHVGSMAAKYKEGGIPFLRSQNIRPFRVSLDNLVFIDERFHRSLAKSSLSPGDVAIVRTGYPGTAAVIPDTLPVSNCSDLVIAKPGPDIDAHYLALFFNSDHGKSLVAGQVVGAAQKHFNVTAAKRVSIALPNVVEQRRVVDKVQAFALETERLEALCSRKIAAMDDLKKSLLHHAFSGQLAVRAGSALVSA